MKVTVIVISAAGGSSVYVGGTPREAISKAVAGYIWDWWIGYCDLNYKNPDEYTSLEIFDIYKDICEPEVSIEIEEQEITDEGI